MKFPFLLASLVLILVQARSETVCVPVEYPTIQEAIDSAANGDTIIVRPGTYFENIDFLGKAITVKSERGPDGTIIDGFQADRVVTFTGGEGADSILDGFTLTNGREVSGGGIYCESSSPTITNNIIYWNKADYGGGINCTSSSPVVIGNTISHSTAYFNGGGIYCSGLSSPKIEDNLITWNKVYSQRGGIYCDDTTPTIIGNTLSANKANDGYGGGLYFLSSSFSTVTENTITGNGSTCGGGIFFSLSAPPISNNTISHNVSGNGGGIYCSFSSPIISANRIEGNICGAGGIYCQDSDPTIVGNSITMNEARLSDGGGIYCLRASPIISGNLVSDNLADENGGGIYCVYDSSPIITNNVIARNTADKNGGGICCRFDNQPTIANNTIIGNSAVEGGGIYCCDSSVDVASTILWDNNASVGSEIWLGDASYPSTLTIRFSDVDGGQTSCQVESGSTLNWGPSMIDAAPLFVDLANADFHLTWTSPCINAGDSSVVNEPFDFEGDPRIVGGIVDMGADEFYYHLYHTGSPVPGGNLDLKVIGYPQAPVTLAWGQTILDPPLSTQHGNLYIWPFVWSGFIGNVPSNGVLSMPVTIPSSWNPGDHAPLQALVGPWGGGWTKLTNLDDVVVE